MKLRYIPVVYAFLLLLVGPFYTTAQAQPVSDAIKIISPADGSIVSPGEVITVTVSVEAGSAFLYVQVLGKEIGFSLPDDSAPYEFSLTIPNTIIGPKELTALGVTGPGSGVFSEPVTIDIETAATLTDLSASFDRMSFRRVGSRVPLTVTGKFDDDTTLIITRSSNTTFLSNDAAVATVDSSGLVESVGPGNTTIVVSYGNDSSSVPVTVPTGVAEPGDLDGDGIIDDEDQCPISDLRATVIIQDCDSGVANSLSPTGCTLSDSIADCANGSRNHGEFVSCVAKLTNDLKKAGAITGHEKGKLQSCAAKADIP